MLEIKIKKLKLMIKVSKWMLKLKLNQIYVSYLMMMPMAMPAWTEPELRTIAFEATLFQTAHAG